MKNVLGWVADLAYPSMLIAIGMCIIFGAATGALW